MHAAAVLIGRDLDTTDQGVCALQDEKAYWASKRGRKTDLPRGKKTTRSKH